jgi:hypothetical protein
MADIKHVGRVKSNGRKCAVVFRVLPNDPEHCLILPTENLSDEDHDSVISLLESNAAQTSYELGEAMQRSQLRDGSIMLARFHATKRFVKIPTSDVVMTPNSSTNIDLKELNELIATQKGVTVADLALGGNVETIATSKDISPANTPAPVAQPVAQSTEVLTDEALAAQYRSQADALYKEAKKLREQAEELVPTVKKSKVSG